MADVHISVMHYCSWDQPQPIYLHWEIYCCIISSTRPYEDNTCISDGILFLWEGWSQSPSGFRNGNSCAWNDMVWQCLIKARWKRALEPLSPHQQNRSPIVYDTIAFAKAEYMKIGDSKKVFNYLKLNLIGSNYFKPIL